MSVITHAKFHSNLFMLTLILASGPLSPPAWRSTEEAGPDRVNCFGARSFSVRGIHLPIVL